MPKEIIKIQVRVSTDRVGSQCEDELEFDREEWNAMTAEQREDACRESMFNMIEWNFSEIEGDEDNG